MKKSFIFFAVVVFSSLLLFGHKYVEKVFASDPSFCINQQVICSNGCSKNVGKDAVVNCMNNCTNQGIACYGNNTQPPVRQPQGEEQPQNFQEPLEKSETQLEIERKNKQLDEELKQELEQSNQELGQKVQEQYQKDRAAGLIKGEETHYGTVQILREGKITSLDSYIKANAGDIIKTGNDGFIEYSLNNTKTKFGPDTLGVTLGLDNSNKKVITPRDWDKDPNYRPELDHWEFWKNTTIDLADFINQNRPDYLESCAVGDVYGCSWSTVEFIHGGVGWFNEKIEKDFKKNMIVTPIVAMVPVGTEFSVTVAQDGATTVTTLDGEVIVMDLTSRKSAIVGANQTITISKTNEGLTTAELQQGLTNINPSSIDKWWENPIQKNGLVLGNNSTKIIILLTGLGFVISIIMRRKQIWPKRFGKPVHTVVSEMKVKNKETIDSKYEGLAVMAFLIGCVSVAVPINWYVGFFPLPLSILNFVTSTAFFAVKMVGLIFGIIALKSSKKSFAIFIIILNIVGIVLGLLLGL